MLCCGYVCACYYWKTAFSKSLLQENIFVESGKIEKESSCGKTLPGKPGEFIVSVYNPQEEKETFKLSTIDGEKTEPLKKLVLRDVKPQDRNFRFIDRCGNLVFLKVLYLNEKYGATKAYLVKINFEWEDKESRSNKINTSNGVARINDGVDKDKLVKLDIPTDISNIRNGRISPDGSRLMFFGIRNKRVYLFILDLLNNPLIQSQQGDNLNMENYQGAWIEGRRMSIIRNGYEYQRYRGLEDLRE